MINKTAADSSVDVRLYIGTAVGKGRAGRRFVKRRGPNPQAARNGLPWASIPADVNRADEQLLYLPPLVGIFNIEAKMIQKGEKWARLDSNQRPQRF
jgi:hypothetical protein